MFDGVRCYESHSSRYSAPSVRTEVVGCHRIERYPDGSLVALCSTYMDPVRKADMRPGDVLVVAVDQDPQHLGILGDYRHGGLSLIHAALHRGVVETRLMFARNMQFRGAFALRGVA